MMSNERVFIAGRTGSGKTYLAKHLTKKWPNLIAYDEKYTLEIPRAKILTSIDELKKGGAGRFVFRPKDSDIKTAREREKLLDEFFRIIYLSQNRIVWVDEIHAVAENAVKIPHYLKAIITRGREKNIGMIALTQRPAFIPGFFMSEAEHYFIFKLQLPQDRDRVQEYIGEVDFNDLGPHEFFYYNVLNSDQPAKMKI